MPFIRIPLIFLSIFFSGIVVAQSKPTSSLDIAHRIEAAERAWLEAITTKPLLVSLGAFPDLSHAEEKQTSILRDRLKLLNRKSFSNRQWREHWSKQQRVAAQLESLYGALARTATDSKVVEAATAKQAGARDWAALAKAKTSNQDAFLLSIQMDYDSVDERLESTLASAVQLGKEAKRVVPAPAAGATPFEARDAHIAELRFRQASQNERHAVAVFKLKLLKQQVKSSEALQPVLKRDIELAQEEHRIAKAQLLSPNPDWSSRWLSIADAIAAKLKKIGEELDLSGVRQQSLKFDVSLAKSQVTYRDQKRREIEREIQEAEAFSGWLKAALTTTWQQAPRAMGLLILILLVGWLALWVVGLATRTLVKMVEDDDPDDVSAAEQRANTIASVLKGIGKIAVYFVGILIACDVVGLNTGPILGSVAILGLALSFGSQNLVRDFVNGFFILVENQYAVGDWVKIGDHEGDVEQINIRSTRLRSVTGVLQIIPNGTITTVENMTREWSCFRCHVGVSYDSDIDQVERICNKVGAEMYADPKLQGKLKEAPAFVGVTQLADSAVVVRSAAKTHPGAQWSLEREMNRRLKKAFDEAGIEIPFPQRVVWHHNKLSG
jgi:small conductance mechanosensitive channel